MENEFGLIVLFHAIERHSYTNDVAVFHKTDRHSYAYVHGGQRACTLYLFVSWDSRILKLFKYLLCYAAWKIVNKIF